MNPSRDEWPRSSGVLMHFTSLAGMAGCGGLGPEAHAFISFLSNAKQTWWQTLPVGPPGKGFSPYSALSSFAGGAHLISVELLAEQGLCEGFECASDVRQDCIELQAIKQHEAIVRRAARQFLEGASSEQRAAFTSFCAANESWLHDWAMFDAIARAQGGRNWRRWPAAFRRSNVGAIDALDPSLREQATLAMVEQFFFQQQWDALHARCQAAGVRLMGDVPFFPALDSADVWANEHLFDLDASGESRAVAGVPPDYFSETGQIWESPLYRWDAHAEEGFQWWTARLRRAAELYDAVRIDHFLGMHRCWRVPADASSAIDGAWVMTPGHALLSAVRDAGVHLPIVAEDLGLVTPEAESLRDAFGFPGMRVLQFAFDEEDGTSHRPDRIPEHCVAYPGTHDNDTLNGWIDSLAATDEGRRKLCRTTEYLGADTAGLRDALLSVLYACNAHTVIVPMQDALGLGGEARMNVPGAADGSWRWRMRSDANVNGAAVRLRALTEQSGRART